MKLTDSLKAAFEKQITLEFQASLAYRQFAIDMDAQDLPGMASWLRRQADEEIVHANKFIDHVLDRGSRPVIGAVEAQTPAVDPTPLSVFQAAQAHEEKVSASIRDLYKAAEAEGDLDARPLLNWFIEEQIEEEATVSEIVATIERVDNDGPGLLRIDENLGQRAVGTTEPSA
ncbi:ferritin [Kytococcus sedentarius]|uniref:ferritin n=1 Tax=Kytococcus sedentarius TaxID=1276 RepID=UPI0035BBFE4D